MSDNTITLTREELYQRIWSMPTQQLAAEFGISDVALGKICRKFNIPKPQRGYWRRLEVGYKARLRPLPPWRATETARIVIHRTRLQNPKPFRSEVQALIEAEKNQLRPILVSESLRNPHPVVRAIREASREARPDLYGRLLFPWRTEVAGLSVSRKSLGRALRILNAFLRAAEERGFAVDTRRHAGAGISIVIDTTPVEFHLIEKVTRKETKPAARERRSSLLKDPGQISYVTTGKLTLEIKDYLPDGMTRRWSDRKDEPLEKRLNLVMGGFIAGAEASRLRDIEIEEQKRRYREAELRQRIEMSRRTALEKVLAAWVKSRDLQAFFDASEAALASRSPANPGAETEWINWARAYARQIDPLQNGELDKMIRREFDPEPNKDADPFSIFWR